MSSAAPLTGGAQLAPLSREEIELLTRLLSDPSYFPREFKKWVTDHSSDTVDIAKSQVHGLVDKGGDVYVPAPPLISQLWFKPFVVGQAVGGGSTDGIAAATTPPINCTSVGGLPTADPIVFEFYVPEVTFREARFNLILDGGSAGTLAHIYAGATDMAGVLSSTNLYLQQQFSPTTGSHTFGVSCNSVGGNTCFINGGHSGLAEAWVRVSRA